MNTMDEITRSAQQALLDLSADLEKIDGGLCRIIDSLDAAPGALPRELASTADAVRLDLLADAAETLRTLALSSDADARERQRQARSARESLLAATF